MVKISDAFGKISEINPANPESCAKNYLSFDIDWACDEVLSDTIDLVEKKDIPVTWLVTHDTPLLSRLRDNPLFELGIHPNFNNLLAGDFENGFNPEEIVDRLLAIVPEAQVLRSHSLVQSERFVTIFANRGITHISNFFIPTTIGVRMRPWMLWDNMIAVPHCWQDNVSCMIHKNIKKPEIIQDSLNVLDFHPIHVFLNTEQLERYESTRSLHRDAKMLIKHRYAGAGTRSFLSMLLTELG